MQVISANQFITQSIGISLDSHPTTPMDKGECIKIMIAFAKLHTKAALEMAAEMGELKIKVSSGYLGNSEYTTKEITYHEDCGGSRYYTDRIATIDPESIISAYPETNII